MDTTRSRASEELWELLHSGYEAYGIDIDTERAWLWDRSSNFFFADGRALSFPDCTFDVIISFGVIEHIGISGGKVSREERERYVHESLRCLNAGGVFVLSFPNGAFPIDFWHGGKVWQVLKMRFHLPFRDYLPTWWEIKKYLDKFQKR